MPESNGMEASVVMLQLFRFLFIYSFAVPNGKIGRNIRKMVQFVCAKVKIG